MKVRAIAELPLSPLITGAPGLNPPVPARRLEFADDFFGGNFGVRLGREIIRRYDAERCPAQDESAGPPDRSHGRAPKARPALIGNDGKLRYLGQIASGNRPRAPYAAMSTLARG
jgi:hypothetical protein